MNISSTRFQPQQQVASKQAKPDNEPTKSDEPQETFQSRTLGAYEEYVPLLTAVTIGSMGFSKGAEIGHSLGGNVGAVIGAAVGVIGGVRIGQAGGEDLLGIVGDFGARIDSDNPDRGRALAYGVTAGALGAGFSGVSGAAVWAGSGLAVAGVGTAWDAYKKS